MSLLRPLALLAALLFAGLLATGEPRGVPPEGALLLAAAAGLLGLLALLTLNRWLAGSALVASAAAAWWIALAPWAALAAGLAFVVALHGFSTLQRFRSYGDRVPEATVRQALAAHGRNLPVPLLVLALVLALVAGAPWLAGALLGPGVADSIEVAGAAGLVLPGLLVLLLPLAIGAWRGRDRSAGHTKR